MSESFVRTVFSTLRPSSLCLAKSMRRYQEGMKNVISCVDGGPSWNQNASRISDTGMCSEYETKP